jgi:hypothetical protein
MTQEYLDAHRHCIVWIRVLFTSWYGLAACEIVDVHGELDDQLMDLGENSHPFFIQAHVCHEDMEHGLLW